MGLENRASETVGGREGSEKGPSRGLGIHLGNINKLEAGVSHDPISFTESRGSSYGASTERGRRQGRW